VNKHQEQVDYKLLYDSLYKAVERLQDRIKDYEAQIAIFQQKEKQWAYEKENQNRIFQEMLTAKNREHNEILEENQRLREGLNKT
jgi:uncharacterized protein YlxW (UPF0749 family)